jgi:DNA modification methylase
MSVLSPSIIFRAIGTLIPNPRNARTHSKKQIRQIADSIHKFNFLNPILIDDKGMVLAGHGRLAAAKLLGLDTVPVLVASGLTETQKRAYVLADNKLAEKAGWDRELLALELGDLAILLPDLQCDLTITGFEAGEIDLIFHDHDTPKADPGDEMPPPSPEAVSRRGDLWLLGQHRLLCGDVRSAEDMDRLVAGNIARMVFTDPPYNVPIAGHVQGRGKIKHREFAHASGEMSAEEFANFLRDSLGNLARCCRDGAIAFVCIDWRHLHEMSMAGSAVFSELKNLVVWKKSTPGQGSFYRSQHELIFVFKVGEAEHLNSFGLGQHGRTRSNVWSYPGTNSFHAGRAEELAMHPTVKPIALVADAMRDCSLKHDIVLDGFLGSGTTLMAAEKIGRRCFGLEIDPLYVDVIIHRWQAATKLEAALEGDGRSWDEIRAERMEANHE